MKKILLFIALALFFATTIIAGEHDQPGLPVGTEAPDFAAFDHTGNAVRLSEALKEGPVVLVFYRGGWCPYCNRQLNELQNRLGEFKALGAQVMAASVDLLSNTAKTVEEDKLGFTVLSDPGGGMLEQYNLVYHVPDETVAKYVEYGIDLKGASGRDDHVIAVPATFVIDTDGMIRYAYANRDYKVRAPTEEVLAALKSLSE